MKLREITIIKVLAFVILGPMVLLFWGAFFDSIISTFNHTANTGLGVSLFLLFSAILLTVIFNTQVGPSSFHSMGAVDGILSYLKLKRLVRNEEVFEVEGLSSNSSGLPNYYSTLRVSKNWIFIDDFSYKGKLRNNPVCIPRKLIYGSCYSSKAIRHEDDKKITGGHGRDKILTILTVTGASVNVGYISSKRFDKIDQTLRKMVPELYIKECPKPYSDAYYAIKKNLRREFLDNKREMKEAYRYKILNN